MNKFLTALSISITVTTGFTPVSAQQQPQAPPIPYLVSCDTQAYALHLVELVKNEHDMNKAVEKARKEVNSEMRFDVCRNEQTLYSHVPTEKPLGVLFGNDYAFGISAVDTSPMRIDPMTHSFLPLGKSERRFGIFFQRAPWTNA